MRTPPIFAATSGFLRLVPAEIPEHPAPTNFTENRVESMNYTRAIFRKACRINELQRK
jgi:hypothetical protein